MGYSARYHATSLVAVFVALAIGILIGSEFGGDALNRTRRNLEQSLTENLQDARAQSDALSGELARSNEFANRVYPALVRDRLFGMRIGLIAFGGLPGGVVSGVEDALGPTGGRLAAVGVVAEPVDVQSLQGDMSRTRFARLASEPDAQTAFGTGLGRQMALRGNMLDLVRRHVFSRASGNFGNLDGVIVVRDQPEDMGQLQRATAGRIESGMIAGVTATRVPTVGVETSTDESSSVSFFEGNDISSVDDIDLVAGRVAFVFAMLGAEGSFGVKGSADRLLPDLLAPGG